MNLTQSLPYSLERSILIRATREVVFAFFTDSARWASWWGAGSTIDPRIGGLVRIVNPGGIEATGEILALDAPHRIVFSYGFPSRADLPPGSSRVTITLTPHPSGTQLLLTHDLANEQMRNEHVQGWRFQLSLFANAVSNEANRDAAAIVDAWFELWANSDPESREREVARIAHPAITMRDRYSCLAGTEDLVAHIAASQRFMPGVRMRRDGDTRHCQGYVLADFVAASADGREIMRGTNIFVLSAHHLIETVVGISP